MGNTNVTGSGILWIWWRVKVTGKTIEVMETNQVTVLLGNVTSLSDTARWGDGCRNAGLVVWCTSPPNARPNWLFDLSTFQQGDFPLEAHSKYDNWKEFPHQVKKETKTETFCVLVVCTMPRISNEFYDILYRWFMDRWQTVAVWKFQQSYISSKVMDHDQTGFNVSLYCAITFNEELTRLKNY